MKLTDLNIRQCERAHYLMQLASYFSELTDMPGVRFAYTDKLKDIWYNQAYDITVSDKDVDKLVKIIENYLASRDRLPCIYLSPATRPNKLSKLLEAYEYGQFESEAWMFYNYEENAKPYKKPSQITIQEIKNDKDLDVFSDVYRLGLPGPEVEHYVQAVVDGYKYPPALVDISYFVAHYNDKPAGMISLLKIGEFVGVYAVATIEEYQGKGIGKSLIRHVGELSERAGCKYVFLQTVVGETGEAVFQKLGYETLFVRDGYTTKSVIAQLQHG